jgi:light-regulated signal transduction histidine kinase (bacteriophytochrome)
MLLRMVADQNLAEAIVETVREPLLLLDGGLRVLKANRSYFRAFSTDAEETHGRSLIELCSQVWDDSRLKTGLEGVVRRAESFEDLELAREFPQIGKRILLLNARLLRQAADRAPLVLLAIEDVTERRALEENVREKSAALERSNRDLQEFAYVASHDLQEPLRMVVSYTELLARRYRAKLDSDADEFIGYAVDGAKRMQRLINDLLAYSRLDRRGAEMTTVSAGTALAESLASLQAAVAETGAQIEAGDLPDVRADERQLAQLFQNLIGNALKFREPSRAPRIRVAAARDGAFWSFRVEDNGIGVDPQYFDKVFIIFERLHGHDVPGTGIGLALCRKIVGRHGSRIWIESEKGRGTTMCFTLPFHQGETPNV